MEQQPGLLANRGDNAGMGVPQRIDADTGQIDMSERLDSLGEGRQVSGQHAFTQVAQVDHGDHRVPLPRHGGCALQSEHGLELALQGDVGEVHRVGGQSRRR